VSGLVALGCLSPGGDVLDLCCGHGRHAVELALRGYRVTGLDLSAVLLREAQALARRRGASVRWVRGDMRELPFGPRFDAVLNLFTSFGYFETEQEDLRVLREVRRVLRPGGIFLLDTFHRDDLVRRYSGGRVEHEALGDALRVTWHSRFDPETSRLEARGTLVFADGRESTLVHSIRAYATGELRALLQRAGLVPAGWYGDLSGGPLAPGSRRLVVVARR
jgi:SAM-dependent methyltransferase